MRPILTALTGCLSIIATSIALGAATAPALATTTGGDDGENVGAAVLSDGAVIAPSVSWNDPGEYYGGTAVAEADVNVLRPSHKIAVAEVAHASAPGGDPVALGGPPLIAAAGNQVAVAWLAAGGVSSGLLSPDRRSVTGASVPLAGSGAIGALDLAVEPGGQRAVTWSDSAGVHVDVFAAAGDLVTSKLIASARATGAAAVMRDDHGGWWVVWRAGLEIDASHLSADGTVGAAIDVGPAALATGHVALAPGAQWTRPWTLVPDGSGGIVVGLPREIVRVTDAGPSTLARSPSSLTLVLAAGDRVTAIAREIAGGHVVVESLGSSAGHPAKLAGHVLAVAFDRTTSTIDVLAERAHGRVYLTAVAASGHAGRSTALTSCLDAATGQILAANGVVAYACAKHDTDGESVYTGGDSVDGHTDVYRMLRSGKTIAHGALRDYARGY
jgi:hypothetical protein